jgi:hypothetical protein
MKPYRLLRNNKETGPYSAQELIAMGLKAYDLVWLDGKSAAWRYPCEIAELKPYAPEAEDMIANFWKPAAIHKQTSTTTPAAPLTRAEKPRIRVKADWRKIEDRAQITDDRNVPGVAAGSATALQVEPVITPQAPVAPVQVVKETPVVLEEKVIPQVKYTESLDSIKQRYNDTVLQRGSSVFPVKMGRYAWLVLVPALGLGIWIGSGLQKEKQPVTAATAPVTEPVTAAVSLQAAMADEQPEVTPEPAPADKPLPVPAPEQAPARVKPAPAIVQQAALIAQFKPEPKPINKPTAKIIVPATVQNNPKKTPVTAVPAPVTAKQQKAAPVVTQPAQQHTIARTEVAANNKPAPAETVAPPPATTGKKIADYVSVKEELQQFQDGKQMKLHVKNNTNAPVDLVVLDLQYYDSNGRFKKGETLYVNHLSANDNVALNAPSVKNAQRIDYKVSLLSIEKNGVYLIAE